MVDFLQDCNIIASGTPVVERLCRTKNMPQHVDMGCLSRFAQFCNSFGGCISMDISLE